MVPFGSVGHRRTSPAAEVFRRASEIRAREAYIRRLVGAVLFFPALVLMPIDAWGHVPLEAWLGVLYLGLFVTLLPAGLYNFAMSRMPTGRAAMAINLVPVVALVTGFLLLGESLAPIQVAACVVIFGGMVLGQMQGSMSGRSRIASARDGGSSAGLLRPTDAESAES